MDSVNENRKENRLLIQESILRDMSEGVITIGLDGLISSVNPAAAKILGREEAALAGKPFARCFFLYEENDAFNQLILDAVYDSESSHEGIVPYFTGEEMRQLRVTTSYLHEGERKIAVIAVLTDITELAELRDAVRAMERIRALNRQLEMRNQLLSETFGRFLSDEIVAHLLDTPDGLTLGGKKCEVSILISDLRGFTALSERMPAQDLVTMLNHYLGEMTEVIERYGGTIIEFTGDGILAMFGAPTETGTHASDAAAAAVGMQARMEEVNRWNDASGFPHLHMGIGINSGEVIVGIVGSERRMKYCAVGSLVNLCGRIESYTVGGQVLVSPGTRERITAELTVYREQEVFPKGVGTPLVLSQITGIGAPYDVSYSVGEEQPAPLREPVPVPFSVIRDKHCDLTPTEGFLTALGETRAVLKTETELHPYDNLQLDIGGKLFVKVLGKHTDGYLVHFTAVPAGFDDWKKAVLST